MEQKIIVAVKGIVLNNGRVLMVKRSNNDEVDPGTWEMPGGKIEFGEFLEPALIREVKEEAGIDITVEKLLYACTFKTDEKRQVVILAYLCRSRDKDVKLSPEHTDYMWASKSELESNLLPSILSDFEKNNILSLVELQ